MTVYCVNGLAHEAGYDLKTWGDLLARLEEGTGPERAVVTAVRFGGVDEPSYREEDVLQRGLDSLEDVDIEATQASELIDSAVSAAAEGLGPLADNARDAADAFRRHDLDIARAALAEVVDSLQMLTAVTAAIARLDENGPVAGGDAEAFLLRLGRCLEALVEGNANEDWIGVADVLEYELADLIPAWQPAVRPPSAVAAGRVVA